MLATYRTRLIRRTRRIERAYRRNAAHNARHATYSATYRHHLARTYDLSGIVAGHVYVRGACLCRYDTALAAVIGAALIAAACFVPIV